jgi:hypothetical protein
MEARLCRVLFNGTSVNSFFVHVVMQGRNYQTAQGPWISVMILVLSDLKRNHTSMQLPPPAARQESLPPSRMSQPMQTESQHTVSWRRKIYACIHAPPTAQTPALLASATIWPAQTCSFPAYPLQNSSSPHLRTSTSLVNQYSFQQAPAFPLTLIPKPQSKTTAGNFPSSCTEKYAAGLNPLKCSNHPKSNEAPTSWCPHLPHLL